MPDFSSPPAVPVVFTATPASIAADNQAAIDSLHAVLDQVAAVPLDQATFENVCLPIIRHEDDRQFLINPLDIYQKLSPSADLRAAADAAETLRSAAEIDGRRADVFARLDAVYRRRDQLALDDEYRKWLEEEHRSYVRNGMRLPDAERARFQAVQKELAELQTVFRRTGADRPPAVGWFTPAELAGVPADKLAGLATGEPGTAHAGKLKVPLGMGNLAVTYASSAATRQAAAEIAAQHGLDSESVQMYQDLIRLEDASSRLLGYASTAAHRLDERMAKTPAAVHAFLQDLRRRGEPLQRAHMAELLQVKQADRRARGLPAEDKLFLWDTAYYRQIQESNQRKEQEPSAETGPAAADPTPAYFPLLPTVAKMLALFGSLFGFAFVEIQPASAAADRLSPTGKGTDLVWHEDVVMYSVWDDAGEGGAFRGFLYLDLYERDGKHPGYMCWPINLGFEHDGHKTHPSTVLMTIFPKPSSEGADAKPTPTLMTHSQMKILFHELGHGIHDLSGSAKCSRFFGASTAGDFNEAPSQMLEQWCYDARGLRALSGHYETGAVIPEALVQPIVASKRSSEQQNMVGMLRLALWDLEVYALGDPTVPAHTAFRDDDGDDDDDDDNKNKNNSSNNNDNSSNPKLGAALADAFRRATSIMCVDSTPPPSGWAQWRFLAGSGAVTMYQYLWSKVHAMDMFYTAFLADPLDGQAGRRYRHGVLEKGATQPETTTLEDFLGRAPSSEAFFADLGLEGKE